jgi:hypothetical protein
VAVVPLTAALAGFLFGFDTAVLSGAEQAVQRNGPASTIGATCLLECRLPGSVGAVPQRVINGGTLEGGPAVRETGRGSRPIRPGSGRNRASGCPGGQADGEGRAPATQRVGVDALTMLSKITHVTE